MSDKKFDDMNTEEKLKWLHDEIKRIGSSAVSLRAFQELEKKVSKLEK